MLVRKQQEHVSSSGQRSFIVNSFSGVDGKTEILNISPLNCSVSSQRERLLPFVILPHIVQLFNILRLRGIIDFKECLWFEYQYQSNPERQVDNVYVETQNDALLIFNSTKDADYRFELKKSLTSH